LESTDYYYSEQQLGIDRRMKELVMSRCLPFVKGSAALDLGYVDGMWTDALLRLGCAVDVVEGAERHVEHARQRYRGQPEIRIFHSLFDDFSPPRKYDTIVAGDMIRYLRFPEAFLRRAGSWLNQGGRIIITVPNTLSLHRRIGTLMGQEKHPADLNQRDREVGNLASYDRYRLRALIHEAGLDLVELRGCFLKPVDSAQMANWSDSLLAALMEVGNELEDYGWFLYAIACVPDKTEGANP
jgi:2-polyprenyl-3-methyl-5-hydroxy-6-metoxy-1,4-benzoquinol methylase